MMMRELFDFLIELSAHNNRDWFHEHKVQYDVLRAGFINDVQRLISLIAVDDEELKGVQAEDCIYRIYRDIRFSLDKTPYKQFFSAYMARGGKKSRVPDIICMCSRKRAFVRRYMVSRIPTIEGFAAGHI